MKRIRALIVSGGCCHDYRGQDKIMMDIMANVLPVDWTVLYEGGTSGDAKVALYNEPNWTKGFDVVVHNECYANVADEKFIRQITEAHKAGVPSMVIHCSLHSYRAATVDDWREFMGATSRRHTAAHKIEVKVTDPENNITKAIPAGWTTPTDELYVIEKLWPNAKALATAVSPEEGNSVYPVVWTNEYGGARVFATTLGHGETWNEPAFRELLVRGLRWTIKNE
jgi:type 1 glutamine amidotransferase